MADKVEFLGGEKLQELIKNAKKSAEAKGYSVGFFASSKYQDGTSVAEVASKHEFGIGVPERPYFRMANRAAREGLIRIIRSELDNGQPITANTVGKLGAYHQGQLQRSITKLRSPANSPKTIKAKGSSNPLIDTGFMRMSATWKPE